MSIGTLLGITLGLLAVYLHMVWQERRQHREWQKAVDKMFRPYGRFDQRLSERCTHCGRSFTPMREDQSTCVICEHSGLRLSPSPEPS